jgi:hypothetical protein
MQKNINKKISENTLLKYGYFWIFMRYLYKALKINI